VADAAWDLTFHVVGGKIEDTEVGQVTELRADGADQAQTLQAYGGDTARVPVVAAGYTHPFAEIRHLCAGTIASKVRGPRGQCLCWVTGYEGFE
jgi:hypothetical protein